MGVQVDNGTRALGAVQAWDERCNLRLNEEVKILQSGKNPVFHSCEQNAVP
jgi:hypothetical protein